MKYPVRIGEHTNSEGGQLYLESPHPFVVEAQLHFPAKSRVLDIGAGCGKHVDYLSRMGHSVIGIENNRDQILDFQLIAKHLGNTALVDSITLMDMREIELPGDFDVILSNSALHLVTKPEATAVLQTAQDLTKQGGINAIRTSNGEPASETRGHKAIFSRNELVEIYRGAGWSVAYSSDQPRTYTGDNGDMTASFGAELIAVKPHDPATTALLAEAEHMQRIDPERAEHLLELVKI